MYVEPAALAVALTAALHAGFQLTVTVLAYPALAEAAESASETNASSWSGVHARHSRRIVPLVALVYVVTAAACVWSLARGPSAAEWVALVLVAGAPVVTAARAASLHGQLGVQGPQPDLIAALLRADRWRAGLAVAGAMAAVLAVAIDTTP